MKKLGLLVSAVALLGVASLARMTETVTGQTRSASLISESLLVNGDFEGDFSPRLDPYTGILSGPLTVANGWEPWYDPEQACPPREPDCSHPEWYNRRPEYQPEANPLRVRSGAQSQKYFTTSGTHTAGLYQQVVVPESSWVRFSIWVVAWSSSHYFDPPEYSFNPGYYGVSVGIDPTGGVDWASPEIRWTVPITRHDEWLFLELDAYTESGEITVWTHGAQIYAAEFNDSYWDDASLIVLESPPAPTPTASPTATPYPTPDPTPPGWEPEPCLLLATTRYDTFDSGLPSGWDQDPGHGIVSTDQSFLHLRNALASSRTFPLAWLDAPWPDWGGLIVSLRFAYNDATGYGTLVGIGSAPYDGERRPDGTPPIWGIGDILEVEHAKSDDTSQTEIRLLGQTVWTSTADDESWHVLSLELRELTYIASVDGQERGRGVSYWRPKSLFVGNPQVVVSKGSWTEVAVDDVRIEACSLGVWVPLAIDRVVVSPEPTIPPPE